MNFAFTRIHAEIAGAVLAAVVCGIALHEHDAHVREQAVAAATQTAQDAYQKQLASLSADFDAKLKARDAIHQQELETLDKKFSNAATPVQVAQLVSQLMGLKVPVQVSTPTPTADNPHPSPVVQIPEADFPQAKSYIQACETCKVNLTKTQADLADRAQQAALAQKTIDSLKKERDTALVAAKGGTTFQRTIRVIKWLVIGGAFGYVAAKH